MPGDSQRIIRSLPFEWGLLENAIDYLREAVRRLEDKVDRRDLKYAVIHLGSGLELLLKERLQQEDWSQLFERPEQADEESYRAGDFFTISVWETMDRLRDVAGVEISKEDCLQVKALRNRRNPLEHFRIRDSHEAVSAVASWALGFALDFVAAELEGAEMSDEVRSELEEIRLVLPGLREFVDHRLEQLQPALAEAGKQAAIVECPRCFQDTAVLGDGIRCLFCGHARNLNEAEAAASDWIGEVLGIGEYVAVKEGLAIPLHQCPDCENQTLVDRGLNEPPAGERWVCFACGCAWDDGISECARCGEPFAEDRGMGSVCRNCFEWVMAD